MFSKSFVGMQLWFFFTLQRWLCSSHCNVWSQASHCNVKFFCHIATLGFVHHIVTSSFYLSSCNVGLSFVTLQRQFFIPYIATNDFVCQIVMLGGIPHIVTFGHEHPNATFVTIVILYCNDNVGWFMLNCYVLGFATLRHWKRVWFIWGIPISYGWVHEVYGRKSGNEVSVNTLTKKCVCVSRNAHTFLMRQDRQTLNLHSSCHIGTLRRTCMLRS
jgi:hypothetical protein